MGRDNSVGIETSYGLDSPGIESLPIPEAERSKTRVCGRSHAAFAGLNLAGDMDVCVVCVVSKDKGQSQDKEVQIKYREETKIPLEARFSASVQTGPVAHPASCAVSTGSPSRAVKRPGRGVEQPPASSAEVKKE